MPDMSPGFRWDAYLAGFNDRVEKLARQLVRGEIDLDKWHAEMAQEIRDIYMAAVIIVKGGAPEIPARYAAWVDLHVKVQLQYLQNWVDQMRAMWGGLSAVEIAERARRMRPVVGAIPKGWAEDGIAARARMYGGSARAAFEDVQARELGIPPMPFQPGDRTLCHSNCKCSWEYRKLRGSGNWDCYWTLHPAEHCKTCLARARAANPLKVRSGQIVDAAKYASGELYA